MQKIESISEMRSVAAQLKSEGKSIALVPTMGALHAGQEALIRAAVARADVVIVAIFVKMSHGYAVHEDTVTGNPCRHRL